MVLTPGRISAAHWFDTAPHRAALPVVYNQYLRCAADRTAERGARPGPQPLSMAWSVPMVSASAGVLSARYALTRANRSATPPG